jgi:hypothetical protein
MNLFPTNTPPPVSVFEDCTVANLSPLEIQRDGDATLTLDALTLIPVSSLEVGDRVRVEKAPGRLIIHGRYPNVLDLPPSPNLIINGTFRTNQRGYVSGTDLALNAYGPDRWKATTANSRLNFTADPYHGQTVTIPAGDSWGQPIERANIRPGTHVLSWPGTAQARIYNVGAAAPAYADSPVVVELDGTANVLVEFGPGTVSVGAEGVKLEYGSTPTPFMLDTIDEELRRCQRYYYRIASSGGYLVIAFGTAASSTVGDFAMHLPVEMRAIPTLTRSALAAQTNYSTPQAVTGLTLNGNNSSRVVGFLASVDGGLTANAVCRLLTNNAVGYIAFDAEL